MQWLQEGNHELRQLSLHLFADEAKQVRQPAKSSTGEIWMTWDESGQSRDVHHATATTVTHRTDWLKTSLCAARISTRASRRNQNNGRSRRCIVSEP